MSASILIAERRIVASRAVHSGRINGNRGKRASRKQESGMQSMSEVERNGVLTPTSGHLSRIRTMTPYGTPVVQKATIIDRVRCGGRPLLWAPRRYDILVQFLL